MVAPPNPKIPYIPRTGATGSEKVQPQPVLVARATIPPAPPTVQPAPAPPVHLPVPATSAQAWPGAGEGLNLLRGPKGERRICRTFDGGSSA